MKVVNLLAKLSAKKQDEEIEKIIDNWNDILAEVDVTKLEAAQTLISEAAFMQVTLSELKNKIKREGATYVMKNGSQNIKVEHPAQKSYNTMINRYTAACNNLIALLPKDERIVVANDDFDDF